MFGIIHPQNRRLGTWRAIVAIQQNRQCPFHCGPAESHRIEGSAGEYAQFLPCSPLIHLK